MKRIFLYGLLACISWTMQSCLFSEDDVFEQSSAERDNASVAGIKELLMSSPNGWNLEYRYGEDGDWGVSNIFMKFDETNVTMASDYATSNYAVGEECQSLYTVQAYQGTEISFDSYNEILHSFCEPEGYNAPGLIGDYEFVVRDTTSNSITLTGKKYGVEMVMTRLSEDVDWATYLQNVAEISENSDFATFEINVNGQAVESVVRDDRAFTINELVEGQSVMTYYPFVVTSEGLRMLEPLTYNGIQMQNFKWDNDARAFICTDDGVDASIVYYCPEGYNRYPGTYTLSLEANRFFEEPRVLPITLEVQKESRTYVADISKIVGVSGNLQLVFTYNVSRDDIEVRGQQIGVFSGYPFYIYPGTADGAYYGTTDIVISGTTKIEENGMNISFVIDEYGAVGADSWFLLNPSAGYLDLWTSPIFTKQTD